MSKWDLRFLRLAREVSSWSKDPSTRCGAVLVSPDRRQVILGYNGFPAGLNDGYTLYADRDTKYKRTVHAEHNAILNARRDLTGYTLYVWPFQPCAACALVVIQAGIKRVVAPVASNDAHGRWGASFTKAHNLFNEAGIDLKITGAQL